MAVVDYDYKFTYNNVGYQGHISDWGVYNNSELKEVTFNNEFYETISPEKPSWHKALISNYLTSVESAKMHLEF